MFALVQMSKYLIFLQISYLTLMKIPKNALELANPTRNTHTFTNKLMTFACGEINSGGENDPICHVPKVKVAESAYSMAKI